MIKTNCITLISIAILSSCAVGPQYSPDASLMGNHIISHGNTSSATASNDSIFASVKEQLSKTPVSIHKYGSSTHITTHIRNITVSGVFDDNFREIIKQLSNVAEMHPDTAFDVRSGLGKQQSEELQNSVRGNIGKKIRSLTYTNFSHKDKRNMRMPFTTDPEIITFIIYPTKLPAPIR